MYVLWPVFTGCEARWDEEAWGDSASWGGEASQGRAVPGGGCGHVWWVSQGEW